MASMIRPRPAQSGDDPSTISRQRLAVRPCYSFPGLTSNHLRVAVRDPADNQRLVDALAEALDP